MKNSVISENTRKKSTQPATLQAKVKLNPAAVARAAALLEARDAEKGEGGSVEALAALYRGLSEHQHQRELFSWAAAVANVGFNRAGHWLAVHPLTSSRPPLTICGQNEGDDRLRWLMAIPNGGSRGGDRAGRAREGARMRSEGVKRGVADIFLPVPVGELSGLFIELKKFGGRASKEQVEFGRAMEAAGYRWVLAIGYLEAVAAVREYLGES